MTFFDAAHNLFLCMIELEGSPAIATVEADGDPKLRLPLAACKATILRDVVASALARGAVDANAQECERTSDISVLYPKSGDRRDEALLVEHHGWYKLWELGSEAEDVLSRELLSAHAVLWHAERLRAAGVPIDLEPLVATAAVRVRFPSISVRRVPEAPDNTRGVYWRGKFGPETVLQACSRDALFAFDVLSDRRAREKCSMHVSNFFGSLRAHVFRDYQPDERLSPVVLEGPLRPALDALDEEITRISFEAVEAWRADACHREVTGLSREHRWTASALRRSA